MSNAHDVETAFLVTAPTRQSRPLMVTASQVGGFLGVVGVLLYLLVGVLYFGSGLVMPYPWVFGMWALWIGGSIVLFSMFQGSRAWTPAVAVGALILWVVIVQLGSWLFDWTA